MDTSTTAPAQRPTLLTIICILSFISGLWGAIDGFRTAFTDKAQKDLEAARAQIDQVMDQVQGPGAEFAQQMIEQGITLAESTAANARPIGLTALVLALISLYGVWLMWNLRKQGFWYYTLAAILGLIVPLFFIGFSTLSIMGLGMGAVISLIFIILYAVNLKHMH